MNLRKALFVMTIIFLVILSFIPTIFAQVKPSTSVVTSGVIGLVSRDPKVKVDYILIDERKIWVSPSTKIFDEWGNPLTLRDLKPGLSVIIEERQISKGSYERRIIVKK